MSKYGAIESDVSSPINMHSKHNVYPSISPHPSPKTGIFYQKNTTLVQDKLGDFSIEYSVDDGFSFENDGLNTSLSKGRGNDEGSALLPDKQNNMRTASMANSIFNLSNAALGAGILGFPYAFKSGGLGAGLVIAFVLLILASFTLHIVTTTVHKYECGSYQEAVGMILGKKWKFLSELVMLLYLIGALVIYLTVVGNCFQSPVDYYTHSLLEGDYFFTERKFIITVLSLLFIFPLCLLKKISSLGFSSVLAFLAGIYLVFFAMGTGIHHFKTEGIADNITLTINLSLFAKVLPQIFMAFPLIAFAFHCHVQMPPIYAELKNPSIVRGDIIAVTTLVACNVLYMSVGIFGYLQFGNATQDDILLNFDSSFIFANIGRLAIGANAIFSYPLNFFTVRLAIQTLFFQGLPLSPLKYYGITIVMFAITLITALFVPGISVAFGICGALGACSLMFIFPGLILFIDTKNNSERTIWSKIPYMLLGIFFIVLGCVLAVCGVSVTVVQLFFTE